MSGVVALVLATLLQAAVPNAAAAETVAAPARIGSGAAVPPWPRRGRIRYVVTYGDGGFTIGETIHQWRVDAKTYTISSLAEPKGLAALRGRKRTQTSVGDVTAAGLRPREFRDHREGLEPEAAALDWRVGRVTFSGGRGEAPLSEGTQDLLSIFYQLAWLMPRRELELAVATASRVGPWRFEWLGEERLELGIGSVMALHLRTRADGDSTEVWLAPAHGGLPVRIRHAGRKGDVFDQTAELMELD